MGIAVALAMGVLVQAVGDPVTVAQSWIAQPTAIESPGLQRISDDAGWKDFWRRHTQSNAVPPALNFRQQMVLVLPVQVAVGEEVVSTQSSVEARLTDAALILSLTLVLKPSSGAKLRTLLTIVALPRSSKPVELQQRAGEEPGAYVSAGKLEGLPGALILTGTLTWTTVEGGTWILVQDQKRYDLHGSVQGFKSGDRVEVLGRIAKGAACIHMVGTIFDVESIRAWKEK